MAEHPGVALVREWTEAWNDCDGDRIAAAVHADFRTERRKADVIDVDGLREVLERQKYGVAMKILPFALYGRGARLAVAARLEYRDVAGDELVGAEEGAIALELRDGEIVWAAPQPTAADALAASGLTDEDLVFEWRPRPA